MEPKFVQVRGSYTRYFVIVYVYFTENPVKKNGAKS
jgi:hypothetical protein